MSALSGKDGKIVIGSTSVAEIRSWRLTTSAANPEYGSSASGGYKTTSPGIKSGRGSARYVLNTSDPLTAHFEEGDLVTLLLYVDDSHYYTVPARIESLSVEVDIDETREVVGGTFEFKTHGAWTKPTYA